MNDPLDLSTLAWSLDSGLVTPAPLLLAPVGSKNSISLFGEKRIKMITRWWQAGRTTVKLLINITDNRWAGGWWLAGYPRHLLLSKIITQNILTPRPLLLLSPPHLWRSPGVLLWIKPNTIWSSWQGKHARQYLISRPEQDAAGHELELKHSGGNLLLLLG